MVCPQMFFEVDERKIGLDNGYYEDAFLSHAHSDHTKGIKKAFNILSSDETRILAGIIDKPSINSSKLRMENAGHILGARQLVAQEDSRICVYTGDFRLRDGIVEKGAKILEADKLIIEATYARRIFKFPDPMQIYDDIAKAVSNELIRGNSVVFGGYSLGKSQEIIKVINDYLGLSVVVHERIEKFATKYKELGVKLDFAIDGSDEAQEICRESFVYVVPPNLSNKQRAIELSFQFGMPFKAFVATGWSMLFPFRKVHQTFALSDHADFSDILYYIEHSNAKEVMFFGGEASDVISHYKRNDNGVVVRSF